jgi:hypothetical protein
MKILDDAMLREVMAELSTSVYFYQKEKAKAREEEKELYEEDGSVITIFTSGISQVEPGEEDILGKIWNPPIKDKDGNPKLDKNGNPKKAWDKFEVKAIIKGKEKVYGLGSNYTAQFRGVYMEMMKNNLKSIDLPGTKWKMKCLGEYKWDITYLGKVEIPKKTNGTKKIKEDPVIPIKDQVMKGITMVNEKAPLSQKLAGIGKKDLIDAIAFFTEVDEKKINSVWQEVLASGVIKEENGKIFFL